MTRSKTALFSESIGMKLFFIFILLRTTLGYEAYHDEKRQSLIPGLVRMGRNNAYQSDDGKALKGGNLLVYPRVGRNVWEFSPLSHSQSNGQAMDADLQHGDDVLLNLEYGTLGVEGAANDLQAINEKRPRLIPRIGRK